MARPGPRNRYHSASLRERAEGAVEVVEAMAQANAAGWPVVVEGASDEVALRELGLTGPIVRLNLGVSVLATVEELVADHTDHRAGGGPPLAGFILLTDWDRTGGQLARRLREAGKACGLRADSEYRRRLAFLTGSQIRCVEDLPGFLARALRGPKG